MFHIVLVEPQIPPNTGSIGRLCVATNSSLHLIHPLGFSTDEKALKRAGMDYWDRLDVTEWANLKTFHQTHPVTDHHFFLSTKGKKTHFEMAYRQGDYFYFGREDAGLPQHLRDTCLDNLIRIPMNPDYRSLNLAMAAGIILYEAIRQNYSDLNLSLT